MTIHYQNGNGAELTLLVERIEGIYYKDREVKKTNDKD